MRPVPDPVGVGQRSVWSFSRPSIVEASAAHVRIDHGGRTIADTRASIRTLETSHPPSYYIPRCDITPDVLQPAAGLSFCEYKGSTV